MHHSIQKQVSKDLLNVSELSHVDLVTKIMAQLFADDYRYSLILESIINFHQKLAWTLDDSIQIQNTINQTLSNCEVGIVNNKPAAMTLRALMHIKGIGGKINYSAAIDLLDQAIALNHGQAMCLRARLHLCGMGCVVNIEAAVTLYKQAVTLNTSDGMRRLACMHKEGIGVELNIERAIELYKNAIDLGNIDAMYNLGYFYHHGKGISDNLDLAIKFYDGAIAQGHINAMNDRAAMHVHAVGGEYNRPKAIALLERSLSLGNGMAMSNRAAMYINSQRKPDDSRRMIELLEKAKTLECAHAIHILAGIYRLGTLNDKIDYTQAVAFYRQAIALKNEQSMYELARMYEKGQGVEVDINKASELYRLAAEQKHEKSIKALQQAKILSYDYHYAMINDDFISAADIIISNPNLITTCFIYDCELVVNGVSSSKKLMSLMMTIKERNNARIDFNKLISTAVITLDQMEKKSQTYSETSDEIKLQFFNELVFGEFDKESTSALIDVLIHLWFKHSSDEMTRLTADRLNKLLCRLISLDESLELSPFLNHFALILGKNICNNDCEINFSSSQTLRSEHIYFLFGLYNLGRQQSPKNINTILGVELFVMPEKKSQIQNEPHSNANCFFQVNDNETNSFESNPAINRNRFD